MDLSLLSLQHESSQRKSRILSLADRKAPFHDVVSAPLERRGHFVDAKMLDSSAFSGVDEYHLVVLELSHSNPDSVKVCSALREVSKVPLLVLVPGTGKSQGVRALELGADSFMLTPFDRRELVARSEALIRRYTNAWRHRPTFEFMSSET